ncbi:MAG: hypothetical protein DRI90_18185 [Deltaproteobacteria bacterium]|nr:MAG: hypothetical protein DRI90_18185 [Deltaproteobacteria bacterium]
MIQKDDKPATNDDELAANDEGPAAQQRPRKERVLHTRVPVVLEQELKRLAGSLRVPVSNVVRTILEDAVDTIDSVGQLAEGELRGVAERLSRHRGRLRKSAGSKPKPESVPADPEPREASPLAPLAGLVGYQPLLLARDERCGLCGRILSVGQEAYLGIREVAGGPQVIIGRECLPTSAAQQAAQQTAEQSPPTEPTKEQDHE